MTHGHLCSMAILRGEAIASDPHVGGNWRHDDAKRPKVQLSKRSERKTQSTRSKSPFSLSLLFFHPPPRRQKLQASVSLSLPLSLSDSARRDSNGMAEITRICFSPSLGTISRLTGAARRQEKNELEWIRKARIKRKRRRGQSHSNRQFIRA